LEISQEVLKVKGKSMPVEASVDETDVNKDAAISRASVSGAGHGLMGAGILVLWGRRMLK
jgi:copper chaperone CopZ